MHENTPSQRRGALLPAAKLRRRKSAKGVQYLAGRLGGVRILVMPRREDEDGDHTHVLFFADASPAPQRDAEAGDHGR